MKRVLPALVLAGWASSVGAVDEVEYFTDENRTQTLRGKISDETREAVTIQKSVGGPQTVPVYLIKEIRYDGQPATLVTARSLYDNGRFSEALERYKEIGKSIPESQAALQLAVAFKVFACQAEMSLADTSLAKEALEYHAKIAGALDKTRHYYPMQELLGRVYIATQDYAKADAAFQQLETLDWPGYHEKATVYRGIAALNQDQAANAETLFDQVISSASPDPESQRQKLIARVYKARCLVKQKKAQEAEKLLRETLESIPVEEYSIKAVGYNAMGDALEAQGKNPKEVILDGYMWVPVVYNRDADETAYALYKLAGLFGQLKDQDRAQQMAAQLKGSYPKSEWAAKLGK